MNLAEFDYDLPADRIAQYPPAERGASRILVLGRSGPMESISDHKFSELPRLLSGRELVIVNNARVIPARLFGKRVGVHAEKSGSARPEHLSACIEVLLTRQTGPDEWEGLVRPGRKLRVGERVRFGDGELEAEVAGRGEFGLRLLRFVSQRREQTVPELLERVGHVPLPPYIDRADEESDRERYQTIFARRTGAVAAPTAGLHFTPRIVEQVRARGAEVCEITLRVGLGTFQPIHASRVEDHRMHSEGYEIPGNVVRKIHECQKIGRPLLAVGTTVVRALEDAAAKGMLDAGAETMNSFAAEADLFIYPGFQFRVTDQLLTNFHLPKSSLLILVSAFAGRERVLRAYRHAIEAGYRFYSYGDCMLILPVFSG